MSGRVLITGGTGFIGSSLGLRLHRQRRAVRVFARPSPRGAALHREGLEFVPGDLRDARAVEKAMAGCDVVVHLGATYRQEGLPLREFKEVNLGGTRHVLMAAERLGVRRVVHVSTVGVFGRIDTPPVDETYRSQPVDHYQRTKFEGELLARQALANGLKGRVVIVRPTGAYGPGDTRFLKLFRALAAGRFLYIGRCEALYQPTYIEDLLDGLELAMTSLHALGGTYILAGAEYMPLREYIRRIAAVLGVPPPRWQVPLWPFKIAAQVCERACRPLGIEPPLYPRRLGFFHNHRAFVIEKARRELGYAPKVRLEQGAADTAAWYRAQGWLPSAGVWNGR